MLKTDKLYISRYNDYYGKLLTEHQREMIRLYYDCDISLFEIAEQFDISRQAVRDSIKRAEALLIDYEEKLGLYAKDALLNSSLDEIETLVIGGEYGKVSDVIGRLRGLMEGDNGIQ